LHGRAGRESLAGKVLIQTYNPDSLAIELASKQDYKSFFNTEIELRKQLKYPPFCDIIVIGFNGEKEENVIKIADKLHKYLKKRVIEEKIGILLYKPLPAPIDKIKNKYRWRIIIKCLYNEQINSLLEDALKEGYDNTKNTDTRIIVDLNPNNMM
jgi:primosomal protein N' (replication factor Y)